MINLATGKAPPSLTADEAVIADVLIDALLSTPAGAQLPPVRMPVRFRVYIDGRPADPLYGIVGPTSFSGSGG